jgi:acetyl-CoA synthetase
VTQSLLNAPLIDPVLADSTGSREIGFRIPTRYNASEILFQNLSNGNGSRTAIIGPERRRSYRELCEDAARFGNVLLSLGARRGDRVLMLLDDTDAYPAAFFGAVRAGLVPLLINTLSHPDLLKFYLVDSGAALAVAEGDLIEKFSALTADETPLRTIVAVNGNAPGIAIETKRAEQLIRAASPQLPAADTHRNDMAFWMYSTGSTGRPKGIVHLQHDMPYTAASYGNHVLHLTSSDICYSVPKMFFAYGFGNSITFPFSVGAASLLMPGQPKPAAIFDAIRRFRPTVFFGLPTLYVALTKAPESSTAELGSLRLSMSAAEVLPTDVFEKWKAMSGLEIVEGLGSTEVLHVYLSNTLERRKSASAGLRVPGYEVSLRDRDGNELHGEGTGILWVRGDSNTPCYWNQPDKTAETIRDGGWINTGDRFSRDADGFYFFLGRADDLVKISGQWVYPLEVELCLAEHPSVRECAVLAVQLPDRSMTLKAFVVVDSESPATNETTRLLQDYVKQKLLPYKYPRSIEFLAELPKTGTGKVDRQKLLALPAAAGAGGTDALLHRAMP